MKESNEATSPEQTVAEGEKPRGLLRRLYDWTVHWAETPYAVPALFVLAFSGSSFFPIPPDVLLMAMALGAPKKSLRFAGVCTVGSLAGAMLGYAIGRFLFEAVGAPLIDFYQGWDTFMSLRSGFAAHGFLWIFGAAFTPIPFKVFTIAAGAAEIEIGVLLGASVIGRGARFFAVGGLFRLFGPPIKKFIDRYFNLLTVLFLVLLVLGFVFVKILWRPPNRPDGPQERIEKEELRGSRRGQETGPSSHHLPIREAGLRRSSGSYARAEWSMRSRFGSLLAGEPVGSSEPRRRRGKYVVLRKPM